MKLKLRIGRQRTEPVGTDGGTDPVREPRPVVDAAAAVPVPRTQERRVVRAGAFCRAAEVGQAAVTESGRAVVSVRAGRCGRWVYVDQR